MKEERKEKYTSPTLMEIGKITEVTLGGSGLSPDCGNDGYNNGKSPEHASNCPPTSPTGKK